MERSQLIKVLVQLGSVMNSLGENKEWTSLDLGVTASEYQKLNDVIHRQKVLNGWFTEENVRKSLLALGQNLTEDALTDWLSNYSYCSAPKRIAIIMAGNIPLVGFHDFICVLLSGNIAICKLSSDDKTLLPALVEVLFNLAPELKSRIQITENRVGVFDAVIATGSDNSLNYFEQYFGKYPHIFRKNRTSVAVLDGSESIEDFEKLGNDLFDYFGLGCRNVAHLLVPENYDFQFFFQGIVGQGEVINHFKYGNNYDYNKTVYLMNQHNLLDNNFMLLYESKQLFSPLAMVYFHTYSTQSEIEAYLSEYQDSIQAVIGKKYIPFGSAQCPALNDYADGVDVMKWLNNLD